VNLVTNYGPLSEMTTGGVPWCVQTSLRKRRAVPSALMVVCIGMKCMHSVRLSMMHIIVLYPWDSDSSTMMLTLIVSHGSLGVSEGWSSLIGRQC
jgi:hypothetical protein